MSDVDVSLVSDEVFARISLALLGNKSAMDGIPLFSPADAQAWRAYYDLKSKPEILISMPVVIVSEEDLAEIAELLLGDYNAMDDIPFFTPAGAPSQAWRAYHYRRLGLKHWQLSVTGTKSHC